MRKPVHFIRADVLERRSGELLARHAARFGPIGRFPVPIEQIIEGTLELAISWEELPAENGLILGSLRPALRTVVVNELARDYFREFPGSESFTFAHEAAHWVLHIDAGLVGQPTLGLTASASDDVICDRASEGPRPQAEWQADTFAANLLIPHDLLTQALRNAEQFQNWPTLFRLATHIGVSITALRIRLEQLGLLFVGPDGELYPSRLDAAGQRRLASTSETNP